MALCLGSLKVMFEVETLLRVFEKSGTRAVHLLDARAEPSYTAYDLVLPLLSLISRQFHEQSTSNYRFGLAGLRFGFACRMPTSS
jgi:hypothetical protein